MKQQEKFKKVVEWDTKFKIYFCLFFFFIVGMWVSYVYPTVEDKIRFNIFLILVACLYSFFVYREVYWVKVK